jgi:hypothetical protein
LLLECGYHGELMSKDVALDMLGRFLVESGVLQQAEVPIEFRLPAGRSYAALDC